MRIVCLSPVVPYAGIPHAGGQYLLRHLRALQDLGHRVTVVSIEDRGEGDPCDGGLDVVRVPAPLPRHPLLRRLAEGIERQEQRLFPVRPVARRRRALRRHPAARAALAAAEIVEYQWTESGWFGLRRRPAGGRHIVVAHDVVLQSYERFREAAGGPPWHPRVLLARWRCASVRRDEGRIYRRADVVLAFSDKDTGLVRRVAGAPVEAVVVRPPLADGVEPSPRPHGPGPTVLFVGAFDRSVNSDAAVWTMTRIAPRVIAAVPAARFVFAGAHPTPDMRRLAAADPAFVVTGRLDSLDGAYAAADVVLVPLRAGAGVKFKTVEAMLRGIPVVSTGVGVEGIVDERIHAFAVADDAVGLAAGIVRALVDPEGARRHAAHSRDAVAEEFSGAAFRRVLADVYGGRTP